MYNPIPPEKTAKKTIAFALLACITLVSVIAAGYFAVLAKDLQGRLDVREIVQAVEGDDRVQEEEQEEPAAPLFTHPTPLQVPLVFDEDTTTLGATLRSWNQVNAEAGIEYCVHLPQYAADEKIRAHELTSFSSFISDEGIRRALLSYFSISSENEAAFFADIDQITDENDYLHPGYTACSDGKGKKFLLLEEEVAVMYPETSRVQQEHFPLVLQWSEVGGVYAWNVFRGQYRTMDGYGFIPDWEGRVILTTGYGDAGFAHWQHEQLEAQEGTVVITTLEKCTVVPNDIEATEEYESLQECEIEYQHSS